MKYEIFENGNLINVIVASADFVAAYCAKNGYTYQLIAEPNTPEPPTQEERLAALESAMLAMMIGGVADV